MQCREFREISDSYLCDELLVETNLRIFRHLENCRDCRADFAARRELRAKLKTAVRSADEFQIDPVFRNRLKANLRESALQQTAWSKLFFNPKLLAPVMAGLVITVVVGLGYVSFFNTNGPVIISQNSVIKGLTEISLKAVGDHKDCALEKLQTWESMSKQDYAEKAVYSEKVLQPLKAKFSDDVEMLHAHDCIFEGKEFTHVIIKKGSHIVSVFFDKTDQFPQADSTTASIISEDESGLRVASFQIRNQAVFVVSDMPETDNLSAARILSASLAV